MLFLREFQLRDYKNGLAGMQALKTWSSWTLAGAHAGSECVLMWLSSCNSQVSYKYVGICGMIIWADDALLNIVYLDREQAQ